MFDHDLDAEPGAASARPHEDNEALSGQDIGRGVRAGRPDALGAGGLLQLQQAAGNSGVAGLVAQRRAAEDGDRDTEDTSPVHDVIASKGSPLDPGTRREMEGTVGADLGDVEVHTDARAADSARSVQAHAYTVGNHVVFGEGRYQPETAEGKHTLAHELTHVVQQRQGPVDGTAAEGGIKVSHPNDRFEQEAESVARRVSSGDGAGAGGNDGPTAAPAPDVQREADTAEPPAVQRQAAEEEQEEEPPAEAAAAGPEAATEAPAEAMPAEGPAPEGGTEAVEEEQEDASVSKLDAGIAVQRQGEEGEEEEPAPAG